jgi:hypothetical protein
MYFDAANASSVLVGRAASLCVLSLLLEPTGRISNQELVIYCHKTQVIGVL